MIGLKTEKACGHCPLSLRCAQGKSFVDLLAEPCQKYNIRFCRRCYTIVFELEHETYLCGIIRYGKHFSANPGLRDGYERVWDVLRAMHCSTKGCGLVYTSPHPLTRSKPNAFAVKKGTRIIRADERTTEAHDCFDQLANSLSDVY